ncbi:hypothetical protein M8320_06730 [Leclercia sp. H6W5]|uniref:hypothetical protein n=1 Tax=Leclercia tamurae TaxID=2926467 RepID=UPI0021D2E6A6|nr:hypothetical protein [Leclercia tamurae]MCU6681697.1 hypothetical protein [Leclercia tamurae]
MKELSIVEMESIAGAYSWDFSSVGSALGSIVSNGFECVASALVLAGASANYGSMIGGSHGGDGGGLLGFGVMGMAIGGAWGVAVGAITGAIQGAMLGWDASYKVAMDGYAGIINGTTGIY